MAETTQAEIGVVDIYLPESSGLRTPYQSLDLGRREAILQALRSRGHKFHGAYFAGAQLEEHESIESLRLSPHSAIVLRHAEETCSVRFTLHEESGTWAAVQTLDAVAPSEPACQYVRLHVERTRKRSACAFLHKNHSTLGLSGGDVPVSTLGPMDVVFVRLL